MMKRIPFWLLFAAAIFLFVMAFLILSGVPPLRALLMIGSVSAIMSFIILIGRYSPFF